MCIYIIEEHLPHWSQAKRSQKSSHKLYKLRVVSLVEFGQEISGTWFRGLAKIAHYVSFLLPNIDRFLKFHFTLGMRQDIWKNVSLPLTMSGSD